MLERTPLEWAIFIFIIVACLYTITITVTKIITKESGEKRVKWVVIAYFFFFLFYGLVVQATFS